GEKGKVPAGGAGTFSRVSLVTKVSSPAGAGKRGYQDGRLPVAPAQQAPGGRERRVPAARGVEHIQIPAADASAAACAPAAAAWPGLRSAPQPAVRSPRRDGPGRHWPDAATVTSGSSVDDPPRLPRAPAGSRSGRASADPRISASAAHARARARPLAE